MSMFFNANDSTRGVSKSCYTHSPCGAKILYVVDGGGEPVNGLFPASSLLGCRRSLIKAFSMQKVQQAECRKSVIHLPLSVVPCPRRITGPASARAAAAAAATGERSVAFSEARAAGGAAAGNEIGQNRPVIREFDLLTQL